MVALESDRPRGAGATLEAVVGRALNEFGARAGCRPVVWEFAAEIGAGGGLSGAAHDYPAMEVPEVLRGWARLLGLEPVVPPTTGGGTQECSGLVEGALFVQVWGVVDAAFFEIANEF